MSVLSGGAPWLRRMRLHIDGLRGNGSRVFESDGTQKNIRIAAHIQKYLQSPASVSEIRLWNLSPATRTGFQRSETKIRLLAGWENTGLFTAFKGNLLTSQSNRSGPDIIITLIVQSGREACSATPIFKPWPPGHKIRDVVLEVARQLEGVTVDPSRIVGLENLQPVGEGGYVVADSAERVLNGLSREWGFSWTIIDGCFQAIADTRACGVETTIHDPYLIEANPILAGARRYQRGVTAKCVFAPSINPGDKIEVASKIDANCNGKFKVNRVTHSLDCFAPASFTTEVVGFARTTGQ